MKPATLQILAAVLGYFLTIIGIGMAIGIAWAVLWAGLLLLAAGILVDL